jgi:uncharacterized DUF497 family protein
MLWNGTRPRQPVLTARVERRLLVSGEGAPRRGRVRPQFDWDEVNERKLLDRHDVSASEAEQCFSNRHTSRRQGKDLVMLGVTDAGRMLHLIYEQKPGGVVRVYHAREMTDRQRRIYRASKR